LATFISLMIALLFSWSFQKSGAFCSSSISPRRTFS